MLPITLLMVVGELLSSLVNGLPGLFMVLYQCLGECRVHLGCGILFVIVEGVQGLVWWVGSFIGFVQWFVWFA